MKYCAICGKEHITFKRVLGGGYMSKVRKCWIKSCDYANLFFVQNHIFELSDCFDRYGISDIGINDYIFDLTAIICDTNEFLSDWTMSIEYDRDLILAMSRTNPERIFDIVDNIDYELALSCINTDVNMFDHLKLWRFDVKILCIYLEEAFDSGIATSANSWYQCRQCSRCEKHDVCDANIYFYELNPDCDYPQLIQGPYQNADVFIQTVIKLHFACGF